MALGYPVTSENPSLEAARWTYWQSSFTEYRVEFGADGRVADVIGEVIFKRDVFED